MDKDESYDFLFKVVIVGDTETGKSCLLSRYTKNTFAEVYQPTIGVEYGTRNVNIDGKTVKAQVWDTAGQERYMAITSAYYRGAVGAVIVCDLTNRETFEHTEKWLKELNSYVQDGLSVILVGNKSDLSDKRAVSSEECSKFAEKNRILYMETSAKNSTSVDEAFNLLLSEIFKKVGKDNHDVGLDAPTQPRLSAEPGNATVERPPKEEKGAITCEVPNWAEEIIDQITMLKDRFDKFNGIEEKIENLCKKMDTLEARVGALEAKKINFKAAQTMGKKK